MNRKGRSQHDDAAATDDPASGRRVVLIVDDSLTFRHTLGDHVQSAGHEAVLADSGEAAIALAARRMPHAAIVDLVMPGIDGLETCKRLRRLSDHLPILMLTASDDLPARMQGRAAGAAEFLTKVPDWELIVETVLDFVRRMSRGRAPSISHSALVLDTSRSDQGLFGKVIAASGLARVLAEPAIVRACRRAGVDPDSMTPEDLGRAMPQIERTLRMFLPPTEFAPRLDAIAALAAPDSGERETS